MVNGHPTKELDGTDIDFFALCLGYLILVEGRSDIIIISSLPTAKL